MSKTISCRTCTYCWEQYERRHWWNYDEFFISKFCSVNCKNAINRVEVSCIECWDKFIISKNRENKIICCWPECTKTRRTKNAIRRHNDKSDWFWSKKWDKNNNPRLKSIWTRMQDWHWYILIKTSEWNWFDNWAFEHVYVMEQYIWRKINSKIEAIHHIDWDKCNNSLNNLFLTTQSYHRKLHQSIFMDLVKELLDKSIIYFDRSTNTYKVYE